MLEHEFSEGEAVVLLKGDLESRNTALRDPTLLRIVVNNLKSMMFFFLLAA